LFQTLGVDAPGPGSYTVQSSIGGGNPIVNKDPSWKFGTSKRRPAAVNVGSGDLGPGDYQVRSSIGAQSESKRRSGPSYTQPRSERDVESTKVTDPIQSWGNRNMQHENGQDSVQVAENCRRSSGRMPQVRRHACRADHTTVGCFLTPCCILLHRSTQA
jgi:hypothetical protein